MWTQLFKDLHQNNYQDRKAVFSDGSLQNNESGCAVWAENFSLMAHLPPGTSIYTAELYGIYCAVKFVSQLPEKYILYTD